MMTDDDEGGEGPCWAEQVCDGCGRLIGPGELHRCVRIADLDGVGAGAGGVVWALGGRRQVEANVIELGPAARIEEHRNGELDVLVVVLRGSGEVRVDGEAQALEHHTLVLVPAGATRALTAGPDGIRYLSIHLAGTGPQITPRRPPDR